MSVVYQQHITYTAVNCKTCGHVLYCPVCDDPASYSLYLQLAEQSRLIDEQLKQMDAKLRILEENNRKKYNQQ